MKGSFADILKEMEAGAMSRLTAKVPAWEGFDLSVPSRLNTEQCSSQTTAEYKAELCSRLGVQRLADLTGGLGVDCWAFSRRCAQVLYNEMDPALFEAVKENFGKLGCGNIGFSNAETRSGSIRAILGDFCPDMIFLDPARRSGSGKKVFLLEECSPDIISLKEELLEASPLVMVKLSPMADISMVASRLGSEVSEIHVIGAGGECKELLCLLRRGFGGEYKIVLAENGRTLEFLPSEEKAAIARKASASGQNNMLFVPGNAALKAGAMSLLAERFPIRKLSRFTHMYFCDSEIEELRAFGRFYPVSDIRPLNGQNLKQLGKEFPKCEVTARNIPMTSEQMLKKIGAASGGSAHIFGVTISWQDAAEGRFLIISGS